MSHGFGKELEGKLNGGGIHGARRAEHVSSDNGSGARKEGRCHL
jgi:hypothetical protein